MPDRPDSSSSVTMLSPRAGSSHAFSSAVAESPFVPESDQKTVISKRPPAGAMPVPGPLTPADASRSLAGTRLGHFQLEEFVGGGGMGAVFRAVDTMLGRTVAVKVVANEQADEDMLRRFRNEAQSAARLDHPNIARVYYVGEDKGWNYIVFEFIEGVNIRELVEKNGTLPIEEAIRYTLQIAEALEHASERDVVHRDIKPSNILVMPDGRVKVVDMGLARLHQVDAPSQDLTGTDVILGTFDYLSPEQARDPRGVDVRGDLYSLGCTLYYMLTGAPPFPGGTVVQKLLSHNSDPAPDPRSLRPDLDPGLCAITRKLMAKLPVQRYQTPGELIDALLILADQLGLPHEHRVVRTAIVDNTSWRAVALHHAPWLASTALLLAIVFGMDLLLPRAAVVSTAEWPAEFEPSLKSRDAGPSPAPPKSTVKTSVAPVTNQAIKSNEPTKLDSITPPTEKPERESSEASDRSPVSPPSVESGKAGAAEPSAATAATPNDVERRNSVQPAPPDENVNRAEVTSPGITPDDAAPIAGTKEPVVEVVTPPDASVVVVSPDASRSAGSNVVASLAAAFEKLGSMPQVEKIELRFRQRIESTLTLRPRRADSELTIQGAGGANPLVVFRPSSSETLADRSLIRLIGGKVHFSGIHFRVELGNQPLDGWSLFQLKDVGHLKFTNCSLTICNDRDVSASFFNIDAPTPPKMMMPTDMMPRIAPQPVIEMKSCVVRGEASLVRATNGLPFYLDWNQGFLAITQPAFVAHGLRELDGAQKIRLRWENVTASISRGLGSVQVDDEAQFVPRLEIEAKGCLFLHATDVPLIEHRGIDNVERLQQNEFLITGERNLYPSTQVLWRIRPRIGEPIDSLWGEATGKWLQEGPADKSARFRRALPAEGRVTYAFSFHDFILEPGSMAGFDESQLPEPREPEAESAPVVPPFPPSPQRDIPL